MIDMSTDMNSAVADQSSLYYLFFSSLIAVVFILSNELRQLPKLNSVLSEAAMVMLIGVVVSFLVETFITIVESEIDQDETEQQKLAHSFLSFDPSAFFITLLPPILFNSGYQLKREFFYRHITPIVLFASLGTIISALTASSILYGIQQLGGFFGGFNPSPIELLAFGSLIAATDTVSSLAIFSAKHVDPHMFYVVFGESALNDAVALVLFKTFCDHLNRNEEKADQSGDSVKGIALGLMGNFAIQAICSPLLGFLFSFGAAFVFNHVVLVAGHEVLELSLYILMMYIPYMLAENLRLSGIVTVFFSGLFSRRYIEPNSSPDTSKSADDIFKVAAYLAETCIFLELGLSVFELSGSFKWWFVLWSLLAALLGRAVSIYPISIAYNFTLGEVVYVAPDDSSVTFSVTSSIRSIRRYTPLTRKDLEIPGKMMHMLWFAGIRGAVAYACVREFPNIDGHNDEFIAATMAVILVTVFVMGGMTENMLHLLDISMNVNVEEYMGEWQKRQLPKSALHRFEHNFVYRLVIRKDRQQHTDNKCTPSEFPIDILTADPALEDSPLWPEAEPFTQSTKNRSTVLSERSRTHPQKQISDISVSSAFWASEGADPGLDIDPCIYATEKLPLLGSNDPRAERYPIDYPRDGNSVPYHTLLCPPRYSNSRQMKCRIASHRRVNSYPEAPIYGSLVSEDRKVPRPKPLHPAHPS